MIQHLDPGHCVVDPAGVVHIAEGDTAGDGESRSSTRVDLGARGDVDADPPLLAEGKNAYRAAAPTEDIGAGSQSQMDEGTTRSALP